MTATIRVRCLGSLDEVLSNFRALERVMVDIETGKILRPELELIESSNGGKRIIHLAALFKESAGVEFEGWFISHSSGEKGRNVAYSKEDSSPTPVIYKRVIFCGSPELMDKSAILSRSEAIGLLEELVNERKGGRYICRPLLSVLARC